jgi:DNA-binding transcriptional LysR family regulator
MNFKKLFLGYKNLMDWDDLKYFLSVVRLGTLTKAAQALHTTPATVARRVAGLEAKVKARLFDRKYTGYEVTDVGRGVLAKAEDIEAAVASFERAALGRDTGQAGKVKLTATEDIATIVIGPQLGAFIRKYPQIQLEISSTREVLSLTRGEAEIALRTVRPPRGNLMIRQAGWWNLALYAAKTYAIPRNLRAPLNDLSDLDIITWTTESSHLRGGPWFDEHARNARVALTANARQVHYAACKAGFGVAILPCALADKDPELVRLLGPERVISAKLWLLARRDVSRLPRVRAVMNFLIDIAPRAHI